MRRAAWLTTLAVATLALCVLVWQVLMVLVLFALGLVMAAAMRPLVDALERRGAPRALAITVPYLAVIAALVVLGYLMGGALLSEVGRAADDLYSGYWHIRERWPALGGWRARLASALPMPTHAPDLAVMAGGAAELTLSLLGALGQGVAILVFALYWETYRGALLDYWLGLLGAARRRRVRALWQASLHGAGVELRDLALKSVLALLLAAGAFRLAGLPYWALPAVVVALARLVPFVGAILAMAGAALAGLAAGPEQAVLAAGIALATHLVVSYGVGYPRNTSHSPVLLLMSAMLLGSALGLPGLIAAPLVAAAAQPLLEAAMATRPVGAPTLDDLRRRTEELRAQGGRNPEVDSLLARLDDLLRRAAA